MKDTVIVINPADNVGVVIKEIKRGETVVRGRDIAIEALEDIPKNHKVALVEIPRDTPVIKYGERIGFATQDIGVGRWVHTHNLKAGEG